MKSHFFVDIHCHSSIKPFARSFKNNPGLQSRNPRHAHSIWFHDAPSLFDKIKNYIASLTNFVQSDGTSLRRGRVAVVCLSFYPQEKGFFDNKLGTGLPSDLLTKLATEFGQERIDHLQSLKSYWEDFKLELNPETGKWKSDYHRRKENDLFSYEFLCRDRTPGQEGKISHRRNCIYSDY